LKRSSGSPTIQPPAYRPSLPAESQSVLSFRTAAQHAVRLVLGSIVALAGADAAFPADAPVDLSGIWVPVPRASDALAAEKLPMTASAKTALADFDPKRHDSTRFCMPYGTPRNTLSTAPYPIEILQRPERLTMIFDRLGDVRRIFLDGRDRPEALWPTWLGYSLGRWESKTLVVETVALTKESVLTDRGLPHSDDLRVVEHLSLVKRGGTDWLEDEITLVDPAMYATPVKIARQFRRADGAQMSEGSVRCLLDQWRQDLEHHNQTLADELRSRGEEGEQ
jgi:hypothetical protein